MGLLQDKLAKYDLPQQYMAMGVYPYFRTIDSHQDTEVLMDGKKVLMFGSNAYTGLTYDKRIIEAATGCQRESAIQVVPAIRIYRFGGTRK